jgi:hypothetical protein
MAELSAEQQQFRLQLYLLVRELALDYRFDAGFAWRALDDLGKLIGIKALNHVSPLPFGDVGGDNKQALAERDEGTFERYVHGEGSVFALGKDGDLLNCPVGVALWWGELCGPENDAPDEACCPDAGPPLSAAQLLLPWG